MFRILAAAAIFSLTTAAQADDSLAARIHEAAVKACAAKVGAHLPITFYSAVEARIDRGPCQCHGSVQHPHQASGPNRSPDRPKLN